jgi:hypothetical protein
MVNDEKDSMSNNDERQVVWVDTAGERHETEFYPNADTANDRACEIMHIHKPIHKIWLQAHSRVAGQSEQQSEEGKHAL